MLDQVAQVACVVTRISDDMANVPEASEEARSLRAVAELPCRLTRRYDALCTHYRMVPTRNNRGEAHENGAIESARPSQGGDP